MTFVDTPIEASIGERFFAVHDLVDDDLFLAQDHRLVAELTWNTFRDHLSLEYEIPKYDGDLGSPNVCVHLDEETARRKATLLLESFPSQRDKAWFTEDLFLALMRLRGMEAASPSGYAEGFHGRKVLTVWRHGPRVDGTHRRPRRRRWQS